MGSNVGEESAAAVRTQGFGASTPPSRRYDNRNDSIASRSTRQTSDGGSGGLGFVSCGICAIVGIGGLVALVVLSSKLQANQVRKNAAAAYRGVHEEQERETKEAQKPPS